jgi:hypothetical protein
VIRRIINADGSLGSALDKMLGRGSTADGATTGRTGWASRAPSRGSNTPS